MCAFFVAGCGEAPDGRVYVTSGLTDEVIQLDAASGAVVQQIPLDPRPRALDEPHGIAVAPDGEHWYATVAHGALSLWKFEAPDDRLVGRLDLPAAGAARIGITPDGGTAFIPDYDRVRIGRTGEVAVVRLHDLALLHQIPVCSVPHDAAVRPDGAVVAVTCSGSDEVVLLDARRPRIVARWPIDGPAPAKPLNAVWSPEGERLFVTLNGANAVVALDTTGREVARVATGAAPAQIALADGVLATANRMGGSLSIIDAAAMRERRRVPIEGAFPHGVTLTPDGGTAFVAYEGEPGTAGGGAVAVDTDDGDVLWSTTAGAYTVGVAFLPDRDGDDVR